MPLILAVEPDKKQAAKIVSLGRGTLKAEVVVAESAHRALQLLAGRVPDLILTSLLLSPRDEAVLTDRLRELDAAASHVQTLVIPVLATARRARKPAVGLLKRLTSTKRKDGSPDGCDPEVFAAQVQEYLERAEVERERAQGAAEHVVSEQHKHLYGDAWAHVDEQSATAATDDAATAALPEGIDPAFALPPDETSWPEPVAETRTDFLRILDDEMRASDPIWTEAAATGPGAGEVATEATTTPSPTLFTSWTPPAETLPEVASFDVVKDAADEPLSVIRPEPVTSPISEAALAADNQWAELESPASAPVADEAQTVYERKEAAESIQQPYEVLYTPVRTPRVEPVPQVEAFDDVREPASEPISVIRAETAAPWAEPARETYLPLITPARTTRLEPLPEVAEFDAVMSQATELLSVIRAESSVIRTEPSEPLSVIRTEPFEPLSVSWAETSAPPTTDVEPTDDRFWARDLSPVLESPQTNLEPLPEVAAFGDTMDATNESLAVIGAEAYTPPPISDAGSAAGLEWEQVETSAIEPRGADMAAFERDGFAEPDSWTPPALFTPAGASNGEPPVELFGFNVVEDLVPPEPAMPDSAPLGIDDQWAEVLLRPGDRDTHRSDPTEGTASKATPGVLSDSIFDLDTTSPPDLDAFVRELSQTGSRLERESIPPSVADSQTFEPEPPQPVSVFEPVPTLSSTPAPDGPPALSLAPQADAAPALILTPPAEPVPALGPTPPADPTPAVAMATPPEPPQAAQAASPAASPSPALPQLEVLEMLTAIRRDLEQMKSERPPVAAQAETQAAEVPVAITPPSQPAESQPRPENRPSRNAPRLAKSTARPDKRREAPRRKKRKTAAPIQDEWGFFDPDQCGFAALLAKLEEIESDKPPTDED